MHPVYIVVMATNPMKRQSSPTTSSTSAREVARGLVASTVWYFTYDANGERVAVAR